MSTGWNPMGPTMCSVLIVVRRDAGEDEVTTLRWHGTGDLFPFWYKTRRKEVVRWPNVLW